jgi:hypothetical protein
MIPTAPLPVVEQILQSNAGTWNRVVLSVGINDTNWTPVVARIALHNITRVIYTAQDCTLDLYGPSGWNVFHQNVRTNLSVGLRQIANRLRAADSLAGISWLSYYQVAGTGVVPKVCSQAFSVGVSFMSALTREAVSAADERFIDINLIVGSEPELLQRFYRTDYESCLNLVGKCLSGWPHPNRAGAAAIASLVPL